MMKSKVIVNNFELELYLIAPGVFGGGAADNNIGKLGANIEMSFAWLRYINKGGSVSDQACDKNWFWQTFFFK